MLHNDLALYFYAMMPKALAHLPLFAFVFFELLYQSSVCYYNVMETALPVTSILEDIHRSISLTSYDLSLNHRSKPHW